MNIRILILLLALGILSAAPSAPAAELVEDTPVYAAKDKKVGTLRKGAQIDVLEDMGEYLRVSYETMDATFEGYVAKSAVTKITPLAGRETGGAPIPERPRPAERTETIERPTVPDRELALSSYWQNGGRNMPQSTIDFINLMRDFGEARVTLKPDRLYYVYKRLEYLSPVADALKTLGNGKVTVDALKAPGLPADSFTGHTMDGYFDGFSRITLVSDRKGQLVAAQLSDRTDRDVWLRNLWWDEKANYKKRVEYSDRWRMINLLEGRTKGSATWQLGYAFATADGVVRLDSELLSGAEWQSRSKERHRTYLPQPIVDLLLQMLNQRG